MVYAGNLMACGSKSFPSDIATPFIALEATVSLHGGETVALEEFLRAGEFEGVIVTHITLPWRRSGTLFNVFKVQYSEAIVTLTSQMSRNRQVMKRPQNCISDINAAFSFDIQDGAITAATAVFGGTVVGTEDT